MDHFHAEGYSDRGLSVLVVWCNMIYQNPSPLWYSISPNVRVIGMYSC